MVRCKMRCDSNKDGHIALFPVTDGSEENKRFFKYTPSGSLQFSTVNADAAKQLEVGQEYYVDITPATQAKAKAASDDEDDDPRTRAPDED